MTDIDPKRWRKQVLAIGALAFSLHIIFSFGFARFFPELGGTQVNDQGYDIALNLVQGKGYLHNWFGLDYHSWRPPVFPLLLAANVAAFGDTLAPVKVMLSLFGAGTAVFACYLGRRIFDARIGLIAGLVTAIDPSLAFSSSWPEPSNLIAFLLVVGCLTLFKARDGGLKDAAIAGVMMGITVLAKTFYLTWPILATIWLLLQTGAPLAQKAKKLAVIWAVTIAIVSPWVIRNYEVLHVPRVATTDTSLVFWAANTKSWLTAPSGEAALPPVEFREHFDEFKDLDEIQRDKWFMHDALTTVKENKGAYAKRVAERIWLVWKPFPYVKQWSGKSIAKWAFMFLTFAPILVAFLASFWSLRREWRKFSLFYMLILGLTGSLALVHAVSRYRIPLEPLLIVQGAYSIGALLARRRVARAPAVAQPAES
jgi:4-amino-4-deoxy-L-arabinose transferase-like glycosyltransferase